MPGSAIPTLALYYKNEQINNMKSIEIIMMPVKDQKKAKAFYSKLGFEVVAEAPSDHGQTWLQMGLPGDNTTIALAGFQAMICETDDIEKEIKQLTAKGISVGKVDTMPWGKFAWIKDEDGNQICLKEK
jgi:catechol 2,3-dioxygenase-like lactoylglutathione lyase family enzyme